MTSRSAEALTAADFPIVEANEHGVVRHDLVEGGLAIESTFTLVNGTHARSKISWLDIEKAHEHYGDCVAAFHEQVPQMVKEMTEMPGGRNSVKRLRHLPLPVGRLFLYTESGPPTWWLPRPGLGLRGRKDAFEPHVQFGWLRLVVVVGWERR